MDSLEVRHVVRLENRAGLIRHLVESAAISITGQPVRFAQRRIALQELFELHAKGTGEDRWQIAHGPRGIGRLPAHFRAHLIDQGRGDRVGYQSFVCRQVDGRGKRAIFIEVHRAGRSELPQAACAIGSNGRLARLRQRRQQNRD